MPRGGGVQVLGPELWNVHLEEHFRGPNDLGQPKDRKRHQQGIDHLVGRCAVAQGPGQVLLEAALGLHGDLGDHRNQIPGSRVEMVPRVLQKFEVGAHDLRARLDKIIQCITHETLLSHW